MMVGLPACGKTYWAEKYIEEHMRDNYTILGTNQVIDQMKVLGLKRNRNYAERWDELISQATPVFNKLVDIASKTPRNIILDQTNVYPRARQRKAQNFWKFGTKRCICIVNDEAILRGRMNK